MRKKELIILALLIVALGLYLGLHRGNRTNYELPEPVSLSTDDIDRIEIHKIDTIIEIQRKGTSWVVGKQAYPADPDKVRGLLEALSNVKLTAMVSESKSYARYDLDEKKRITIKAWKGEKRLRELMIGKPAATFQHTHVMLSDNPNVYHAGGDFRRIFDRDEDSFEDKTLFRFDMEKIRDFQIRSADRTIRVTRFDPTNHVQDKKETGSGPQMPPKPYWVTTGGARLEDATVTALLGILHGLQCEQYTEIAPEKGRPSDMSFVWSGPEEYRLDIYDPGAGPKTPFIGESSTNRFSFALSDMQVETLRKKAEAIFQAAATAS